MQETGNIHAHPSLIPFRREIVGRFFGACLGKGASRLSLRRLVTLMAVLYAISLIALLGVGLRPSVPWQVIVLLPIYIVPFAIIFVQYNSQGGGSLGLHILAGAAVLVTFGYPLIWPFIAAIVLLLKRKEAVRWEYRLVLEGLATTILGYASLWNLNYLLARFVPATQDPKLRAIDEWIYSWFIDPVQYTGFFPILRDQFLLQIFNNAYFILFPEVILVLLLVCQMGNADRVTQFLTGLFGFYAIGILCFVMYPAIGPCLYYPESLDLSGADMRLVAGMLHDYQSAVHGGPLLGYGYFIAVPSLHVIIALYLQRWLAPFARIYQVFLPVNIVLVLSTVVLGYHYIADTAAALLIMAAWCPRTVQGLFSPFPRFRNVTRA